MDGQTVTFSEAVACALRMGGLDLLQSPKRFVSVVTDLIDPDSVEARLLYGACDERFFACFSAAAGQGTPEAVADAVDRASEHLQEELFVERAVAQSVCNQIGVGLAAVLGVAYEPREPVGEALSASCEEDATDSPDEVAASPVPRADAPGRQRYASAIPTHGHETPQVATADAQRSADSRDMAQARLRSELDERELLDLASEQERKDEDEWPATQAGMRKPPAALHAVLALVAVAVIAVALALSGAGTHASGSDVAGSEGALGSEGGNGGSDVEGGSPHGGDEAEDTVQVTGSVEGISYRVEPRMVVVMGNDGSPELEPFSIVFLQNDTTETVEVTYNPAGQDYTAHLPALGPGDKGFIGVYEGGDLGELISVQPTHEVSPSEALRWSEGRRIGDELEVRVFNVSGFEWSFSGELFFFSEHYAAPINVFWQESDEAVMSIQEGSRSFYCPAGEGMAVFDDGGYDLYINGVLIKPME